MFCYIILLIRQILEILKYLMIFQLKLEPDKLTNYLLKKKDKLTNYYYYYFVIHFFFFLYLGHL